eukprot:TRINITY_DN9905_c0_g1_i1.p1 TRINITY_DN9905_c0_g1~~TRINITY_DN9905_c0_g1_i1.p1  ORF type:complete len:103 (+),score=14.29 TRINITY_DN9905_c0_g1_i1:25-309(+)
MELLTDFAIACYSMMRNEERSTSVSYNRVWDMTGRSMAIDVCLLTTFFAIDAHTLLAQFLCPGSSGDGGGIGVLGRLLQADYIGVVGQCPKPLF